MRALILAGGEGSRLRPLTHTNAKQLIPVAGAPILFHALGAIRDAGITEVGIVIGQTGDEIRTAVADGSAWGLSVSYIQQTEPLGLAHAVLTARDFVAGQPFLMYLGDNVLLEGLKRFVDEFERTRPDAQIFLARVPGGGPCPAGRRAPGSPYTRGSWRQPTRWSHRGGASTRSPRRSSG